MKLVKSSWKNIFFVLFVLCWCTLLSLPSTAALALSGRLLSPITYVPGTTLSNEYAISGAEVPVQVSVDGGIFKHISVSEVKDNRFTLLMEFPAEERITPGNYNFGLTVSEIPQPGTSAVNTLVSVSKSFEVIVYSFEKDIQVHLEAPNINQGSKTTFQLVVSSVGYPDIEAVRGEIAVFNDDKIKIGHLQTDEKPLPGLGTVVFTPVFNSSSLPAARYWAEATAFYDGKLKTANTTFLIGNMDVILENYTSTLEQGYPNFVARVRNNWGNRIRGVHLRLSIDDTPFLDTPSIDLEPWAVGELGGLMQVDLEPGIHPGELKLFYEGEMKTIPIQLVVKKAPVLTVPVVHAQAEQQLQEARTFSLMPALVVVLLLCLAIMAYLFKRNLQNTRTKTEGNHDDF